MPIVLISSPPHGVGSTLARHLADKTGWPFYSREQLVEEARDQGIKLSRLETSIIKAPIVTERLAFEKELFLSFLTDTINKKADNGNLVYSGRAAHFILPGVSHLLRVGVGAPWEIRIENAVRDLNLSQEQAINYLDSLDKDIQKWVRYVYREDYNEPAYFDLFLNMENMSLDNASVLLCQTAEMPAFQPSPESRQRLEDYHLAARARLHLARNKETAGLNLGVRARNKTLTVTYMPRQEAAASSILKALEGLEGCGESLCTMAETNILYLQETFDPKSEHFKRVTQLAKRWGAAVELLRLLPKQKTEPDHSPPAQRPAAAMPVSREHYNGGVEDDGPEMALEDGGLTQAQEELIAMGRAAGSFTVSGSSREVIAAVKEKNNYSLVVLGDLFAGKGHETSIRLTRELGITMHEKLKAPVITIDELESKFMFGKMQALKLLVFISVTICIYATVFSFQKPILNFLGGELHEHWKWAASISVGLFVPFVAYIYSTVSGLFLKLIDID